MDQTRCIYGEYRPDGTWIGYDYDEQHWIDTAPYTQRDPAYPAGSACNPLAQIPADAHLYSDTEQ